MRTRVSVWGVIMLACLTGTGSAQQPPAAPTSYPAEMSIVVPEVEVRSGPTKQHYPTSLLHQGERVTVMSECKDQPGWAAIKPPPASFSWIREKYVKVVDARTGFVQAPNNVLVDIMPASRVVELQTLTVVSNKLPSGVHVTILDKPFHWDGENWLRIQPTPNEVRYLPMSALRRPAPAVAVASGFPTSAGGDLLASADQAYRAGNVEQAKLLYRQAADKSPEPQKTYALNRLSSLSANGSSPVSTQSNWQPVGTGAPPLGSLSNSSPAAPKAAQTISNHTVPGPTFTSMQPSQWSGWGYLRRAGFEKDGQPVYVLESRSRQPLLYAVEQPGAVPKLQAMVGRLVCLYGPIAYRSEDYPRVQYMVTSHYALP